MRVDSAIRAAVGTVVGLLVNRQYDVLEAVTRGDRWSAAEIRRAIEQHGETLVHLPDSGWEELQLVAVEGAEPETFDVDIPLYTEERGRSDLWLSLQLIDRFRGAYDTRLMDLRVRDDAPDLAQRLAPAERPRVPETLPLGPTSSKLHEPLTDAVTDGEQRDPRMTSMVVRITNLLAAGDYETAAHTAGGRRLSAADLERAVRDYGRTLVPLPPAVRDRYDVYRFEKADRPTFAVDVDLWTREEGRSDLTLRLELTDTGRSTYAVTIQDLHVL